MSWSLSLGTVERDAIGAAVEAKLAEWSVLTPGFVLAPEDHEQIDAAIAAATALAAIGTGPVVVALWGHANPEHSRTEGAQESINVSVTAPIE